MYLGYCMYSHPYLFVAIPGTPQVLYYETSTVYTFTIMPGTICTSCLTRVNVTQLNLTTIFVIQQQAQTWVPVNLTREWADPGGLSALHKALAHVRAHQFVGVLVASIVSAVVIIGTATTASVALTDSIQTAHAVDVLLTNTTQQMI